MWRARRSGRRGRTAAGVGRRGFTLLEVLLVLVLIAFLSGVLLVGGPRWAGSRVVTLEDVFWSAVEQSRDYALLHHREVNLNFDAEAGALVAHTAEGPIFFTLPETLDAARIEFLAAMPGGAAVLIGGTLVETQTLPRVTFYGDGTCTPFRAQLRQSEAEAPTYLTIDPWTCAPVLAAPTR